MTSHSFSSSHAVQIEELEFRYPDGITALHGVTLAIEHGESVCLAGPNGAGKSTLLLILAGLLRVPEATVRIRGAEPVANAAFGLVFQDADDQLFCPTIAEDIGFGPRNQKLSEVQVARRISESLEATGLVGFDSRSTHHLSGGEKKRAAIAAVLACHPSVLALDEPWANLDLRGTRAVTKIIREFDGTRIVTTQDLTRAADVCDRIVILDQGRIAADGPIDDILDDEALLAAHGLEFGHPCRFCGRRGRARERDGSERTDVPPSS